jgi:hypothetical protein
MIHIDLGLRRADWDVPVEIARIFTRIPDLQCVSDPAGSTVLTGRRHRPSASLISNVMIDTLPVVERAMQPAAFARLRFGYAPSAQQSRPSRVAPRSAVSARRCRSRGGLVFQPSVHSPADSCAFDRPASEALDDDRSGQLPRLRQVKACVRVMLAAYGQRPHWRVRSAFLGWGTAESPRTSSLRRAM